MTAIYVFQKYLSLKFKHVLNGYIRTYQLQKL